MPNDDETENRDGAEFQRAQKWCHIHDWKGSVKADIRQFGDKYGLLIPCRMLANTIADSETAKLPGSESRGW